MTDQYLSDKERVLNEARLRAEQNKRRLDDAKASAARLEEVREAEQKAVEDRRGLLSDAGVGAVRGVPGAAEETFDLLATLDEWSMRKYGALDLNPFDGNGFGWVPAAAYRDGGDRAGMPSGIRIPEDGWREIKELIPETERGSGAFTEATSSFLAGFFTGKKGLQAEQSPPVGRPILDGDVGYHIREGGHSVEPYDWEQFLEFASRHLGLAN